MDKSKQLKYSKKYFSYVLVLEDEQQPELVGQIMVFQYGKIIKDKISSERNGEISGVPVNIFDPAKGKDFVLVVKEIQTGDETYPDYKMSMFKPEATSLPIFFKDKAVFKNVPLVEGKIAQEAQGKVREFLLDRQYELETYSPKALTDEQQAKITEISNFLTGKASTSFANTKASTDDFTFDDYSGSTQQTKTITEETDDDFFGDM